MLPLKKILCPTDFSGFSFEAIEQGAELARHFDAQLCILHVTQKVQPVQGMSPFLGYESPYGPQYGQAVRVGAEHELDKIVERHHLNGIRVRALLKMGHPVDEIVATAEEEHTDLLVIATHGLSGWRHLLFGSVTDKVLRLASCPVLITRVKQPKEK